MVKKTFLKLFEKRMSIMVVESFMMTLMILICAAVIGIFYVTIKNNSFDYFPVIVILELFQSIILLTLVIVCMRLWEKRELQKK